MAFRRTTQRSWVAWLAMVALWLTIVAPVISQAMPSAPSFDLGAWCTGHGLSDQHPATPGDPLAHTDKCGYCGLLGHSPLLPGVANLTLASVDLLAQAPVLATVTAEPAPRLLSAHPRGPPALI